MMDNSSTTFSYDTQSFRPDETPVSQEQGVPFGPL